MKFLIVGLGNPGVKYENTRHNIGFKALDHVAKQANAFFSSARYGETTSFKYKGKTIILLKPSTFMNLSGNALKYWLIKEKISLHNCLVVTDDINLPIGTIRMKKKGSDGGHNGLRNIQDVVLTVNYPRLRVGIGNSFSKGKQIDHVLGEWEQEEMKVLSGRYDQIESMILSFCFAGIDNTMNMYNNKKAE